MDLNRRTNMIKRLRSLHIDVNEDVSDDRLAAFYRAAFGSDELAGNASTTAEFVVNGDDADMLRLCTEVQTLVRGASGDAMQSLGLELLEKVKKTLKAALKTNADAGDTFDNYSLNGVMDQTLRSGAEA